MSPLGLGTLMLPQLNNHEEAVRLIHTALDAGINYVDTADCYDRGEAEIIVGKALAGRRDDVILGSKFTLPMGDGPNMRGHSRGWIIRAVEASLRRLRTDYIDVYQVHRPDPQTDPDELLSALTDLVHQGKVRTLGTSNFPSHLIVECQWIAEKRGRERFRCEQPPYSIFARGIERDVLPVCQQYGIGVVSFSPLNYGWLSGKYRPGIAQPVDGRAASSPDKYDLSAWGNQRKLELVLELEEVASEAGLSLIHLALGFVIQHPAISAAIIGPRTIEQLDGQIGALALTGLDGAVMDRIDALVPPGTTLLAGDAVYRPPSLEYAALRRRDSGLVGVAR